MKKNTRIQYRYSEAFKQQVVSEIASGKRTISEAKRAYGIKGGGTVQGWARKMGNLGILTKTARVEKPDEKDRIKALEAEIKKLRNVLADTVLDKHIAESTLEILCEDNGWDIESVKKKAGTASPVERRPKGRP